MGCDIHVKSFAKTGDKYFELHCNFFDCRDYSLFGFLANVRNYSAIKPISKPRDLPDWFIDPDPDNPDFHTPSWLTLEELESYDYDQIVEDRQCTIGYSRYCTCAPGKGVKMTLREFLGEWYFKELAKMKELNVHTIVFWFDN